MKKIRILMAVVSLTIILCSSVSAGVAEYKFKFPDYTHAVGSMRWSGLNPVVGGTPYVYPDYTYHSTNYFISPLPGTTAQATDIQTVSIRSKKYFTWKSGYGGYLMMSYLAGYPDSSVPYWPEYDVKGVWSD